MQVAQPGVAGNIEHADELAKGVVDRRCRAAEDLVRSAIVLAATNFDRNAFDDGGADGVGSDLILAPAGAGTQRHLGGLVEKLRIAGGIDDPAAVVGQQHDAACGHGMGGEGIKLRPGVSAQALVAVAQFAKRCIADRLDGRRAFRSESQALAALPGREDVPWQLWRQRAVAIEEGMTGGLDGGGGGVSAHVSPHVSHFATGVACTVPLQNTSGLRRQ